MKVLFINGSPRTDGNTDLALREMTDIFEKESIETEIVRVGGKIIKGCISCCSCKKLGKCAFDDEVNEIAEKLKAADGLVLASPVYYASANGSLITCLDRLFYSRSYDVSMKVGTSVVVARRGGCSSAFDELNKYLAISGMTVATSCSVNAVHGMDPGEAARDEEGLQAIRNLARNMTFLMRSIALGKEKYGLPEKETIIPTNFIR